MSFGSEHKSGAIELESGGSGGAIIYMSSSWLVDDYSTESVASVRRHVRVQ